MIIIYACVKEKKVKTGGRGRKKEKLGKKDSASCITNNVLQDFVLGQIITAAVK